MVTKSSISTYYSSIHCYISVYSHIHAYRPNILQSYQDPIRLDNKLLTFPISKRKNSLEDKTQKSQQSPIASIERAKIKVYCVNIMLYPPVNQVKRLCLKYKSTYSPYMLVLDEVKRGKGDGRKGESLVSFSLLPSCHLLTIALFVSKSCFHLYIIYIRFAVYMMTIYVFFSCSLDFSRGVSSLILFLVTHVFSQEPSPWTFIFHQIFQ